MTAKRKPCMPVKRGLLQACDWLRQYRPKAFGAFVATDMTFAELLAQAGQQRDGRVPRPEEIRSAPQALRRFERSVGGQRRC
jgi:hypothetical protein